MYLLLTAKPEWIKNLNLKVNVKVTKSLFSKMKKNRVFLADLNRYWKVLQKGTKKINNIFIENYVCSIDSETKMDQYLKSEGQCQGHEISIFEIVEKHGFSVNSNQFWSNIAEDDKKINNMVIEDNVSTINSKTKWVKN